MDQKTILVVEDDRAVRDFLVWALKSAGYHVVTASNAEEAKGAIAEADLMMLDLSLPGISGEQLLTEVRSRGNYIPTVIVSGTADEKMKSRLKAMEIVDFVEKPFSKEELFGKVARGMDLSPKAIGQCDRRLKGFIERQHTL